MRVLYLAGPGDVASTYKYWRLEEDDPSETNVTYSGQFFSVCRDEGVNAYVISTNKKESFISDSKVTIEHRGNSLDKAGGLKYHYGQFRIAMRVVIKAVFWRADCVIISGGTHYFLLWPLALFGIKLIPTIHCALWQKYKPKGGLNRCISLLNGLFFKYLCAQVMSASKEISRQLNELGVYDKKIHEFMPLYRESNFKEVLPVSFSKKPFRIIYIGRIEEFKGVFDLLDVFNTLVKEGLNLELDYCGTGYALNQLKSRVKDISSIKCHGHCNKGELLSIINKSHVFVVPTKTTFVEGFNQVVVESILCGRPVITSDVCPAMEYVLPAALVSEPDNLDSYAKNIKKLYENEALFQEKVSACVALKKSFYNDKYSWGAVFQSILNK